VPGSFEDAPSVHAAGIEISSFSQLISILQSFELETHVEITLLGMSNAVSSVVKLMDKLNAMAQGQGMPHLRHQYVFHLSSTSFSLEELARAQTAEDVTAILAQLHRRQGEGNTLYVMAVPHMNALFTSHSSVICSAPAALAHVPFAWINLLSNVSYGALYSGESASSTLDSGSAMEGLDLAVLIYKSVQALFPQAHHPVASQIMSQDSIHFVLLRACFATDARCRASATTLRMLLTLQEQLRAQLQSPIVNVHEGALSAADLSVVHAALSLSTYTTSEKIAGPVHYRLISSSIFVNSLQAVASSKLHSTLRGASLDGNTHVAVVWVIEDHSNVPLLLENFTLANVVPLPVQLATVGPVEIGSITNIVAVQSASASNFDANEGCDSQSIPLDAHRFRVELLDALLRVSTSPARAEQYFDSFSSTNVNEYLWAHPLGPRTVSSSADGGFVLNFREIQRPQRVRVIAELDTILSRLTEALSNTHSALQKASTRVLIEAQEQALEQIHPPLEQLMDTMDAVAASFAHNEFPSAMSHILSARKQCSVTIDVAEAILVQNRDFSSTTKQPEPRSGAARDWCLMVLVSGALTGLICTCLLFALGLHGPKRYASRRSRSFAFGRVN
jgi:hypothetical protein